MTDEQYDREMERRALEPPEPEQSDEEEWREDAERDRIRDLKKERR